MLATIPESVQVALVGLPAALVSAAATLWWAKRGTGPALEPVKYQPSSNGYATKEEVRRLTDELKQDIRDSEDRTNSKLDLIVSLIKKG